MEVSDQLRCLFSAAVEQREGSYVIEVPERELRLGDVREGDTYRVAILGAGGAGGEEPADRAGGDAEPPEPPVNEGDTREVTIEDLGEQGDGIARVERGFVVIVPDTDPGERVRVEVTDVRENLAFAEVREGDRVA